MTVGQFGEINPPYIDGVGQVMLAYCRYLPRRGHRSVYIAPSNPKTGDDIGCEAIFYRSLPLGRLAYRFGFPAMDPSWGKKLKDVPFDIVHAHAPFLAGHAALRLARKRGIPIVATFHSKYYDDVYKATRSRRLAELTVRYILRFFRQCDEVWAVNESSKKTLTDYGYRGDIVVMPNGTDVFDTSLVPDKLPESVDIADDERLLLFVGQLDFKKNPQQVIRAAKILKDQGLKFKLALAGEGPDHHALASLADELSLKDTVIFTGRISDRSLLMALYRRADLFTFPSLYDNAALVIREAAMMGTPPLVARGSCSAEGITDGVNGYISDVDEASLARRIAEALPTCHAVGLEAQKKIPVSWEALMEKIEARYEALIQKKKQS